MAGSQAMTFGNVAATEIGQMNGMTGVWRETGGTTGSNGITGETRSIRTKREDRFGILLGADRTRGGDRISTPVVVTQP